MSQPFDISAFPDLPPEVVKAFEMQCVALKSSRFEASLERGARLHEQAAVAELTELVEKLQGQIAQYKRAKFAPAAFRVFVETSSVRNRVLYQHPADREAANSDSILTRNALNAKNWTPHNCTWRLRTLRRPWPKQRNGLPPSRIGSMRRVIRKRKRPANRASHGHCRRTCPGSSA